jgi:peptidoglycan hydrolase-like protein with peptidoglycan-binding domain
MIKALVCSNLWFECLISITMLSIAAPVFAVQPEARFGSVATLHPQTAARQVAATAVALPLLVSQADSYLRLGDRGAAVTDLQRRLAALGYYRDTVDGDFGSQTQNAVRQFQQAQGLPADGVVGPATDSALRRSGITSMGSNSGSPTRDQGRFSISELQTRLRSRGFYQGLIDGVAGPSTQTAIRAARRAYDLTDRDILNGNF